MKIRLPIIALALGLMAFGLLFVPELIVRYEPQTAKLTYSLTKDVTQGLGITFFILFLWTSGTLFHEHRRLSIGLLLAALVPISIATVLSISDIYRAVHSPRVDQQGMIRDNF